MKSLTRSRRKDENLDGCGRIERRPRKWCQGKIVLYVMKMCLYVKIQGSSTF